MSSDSEDWIGSLALLIVLVGAIGFVVVIGIMMLPVAAVGLGGAYYVRNYYLPAKRKQIAADRTAAIVKAIEEQEKFSDIDLIGRLREAGITDHELVTVAIGFYEDEGMDHPGKPPPLSDSIQAARYRDKLMRFQERTTPEHVEQFVKFVIEVLEPEIEAVGEGMFTGKAPRSPDEIEEIILRVYRAAEDRGCAEEVRKVLNRNLEQQNGNYPSDYRGDNCAYDYLKNTPLMPLEYRRYAVDLVDRMAHTMILGGSGSGKTNLLEYIIAKDLERDDCTVVVIDSQVQMIPKLAKLDLPIEEVTYLNPKWNLGLNLFDVGYDDLKSSEEGEAAINKAVGLIRFVLEGALTAQMTDRQRTMFDYAIQLIISIKGGNILTFLELLDEDGHLAYEKEINKLDTIARDFFMRDWGSDDYKRTRLAIRSRLLTLLKNPTFARLFSSTENKFRVYDELQDRRLILLDTNKPGLDNEGSAFLGRLYIAMIVQAAHRRFENSRKEYRPVYLVIDEAQEYFDERIAEMLEQARKANIGLLLAHQTISQIKRARLDPATVIGNTATKLVSTTYQDDAREMAKSMRINAETLLDLPQYTFGLYNRKTGFRPVRAPQYNFAGFEFREDAGTLKEAMEARYESKRDEARAKALEPDIAAAPDPEPPPEFEPDDVRPI